MILEAPQITVCVDTQSALVDLTDTDRRGFRYWNNPGAVARADLVHNVGTDRFLGILSVIVQAAFSFQGVELVAIAASETESPRRNIATAASLFLLTFKLSNVNDGFN